MALQSFLNVIRHYLNLAADARLDKQCTLSRVCAAQRLRYASLRDSRHDNIRKDWIVSGRQDITGLGHSFNHLIDLSAGRCDDTLRWFVITDICINPALQWTPQTTGAALIRLGYWFPPTAPWKQLRLSAKLCISLAADGLHARVFLEWFPPSCRANELG